MVDIIKRRCYYEIIKKQQEKITKYQVQQLSEKRAVVIPNVAELHRVISKQFENN